MKARSLITGKILEPSWNTAPKDDWCHFCGFDARAHKDLVMRIKIPNIARFIICAECYTDEFTALSNATDDWEIVEIEPEDVETWRDINNLTQAQAATRLGVDFMTLSRWERGVHVPTGAAKKALERELVSSRY